MIWTITLVTFIATAAILLALFYALAPGEGGMASRLSRLINPVASLQEDTFADKQKERVRSSLAAASGAKSRSITDMVTGSIHGWGFRARSHR